MYSLQIFGFKNFKKIFRIEPEKTKNEILKTK